MIGEIIGGAFAAAHLCAVTCIAPLLCGWRASDVCYSEYQLLSTKDE